MKMVSIKKWALRLLLVFIILNIILFLWAEHEIDQYWGAHTTVVDPAQFNLPQQKMVITNVNTLSSDGNNMLAGQSVLIDRGVIDSIGADISIPQDAVVIDGTGQYLIPGLMDAHVHLWQSPNDLLLYVANGVTHVRELNGSPEHLQWRQEIKEGRLGPHLFVASSRLNSNGLFKAWFDAWTAKIASVNQVNDAESVVQKFSKQGFDAIKIYTFLSKDHFFHMNTVAGERGVQLLGHIPITMQLDELWQTNLKELAHIEEIVKALNREFGGYTSSTADAYLRYVRERSDDVAEQLKNNNMAVVSTLWLMESFARQKQDIHSTLSNVELAYVNPGIAESTHPSVRVMGWLPEVNIYRLPENLSAERKRSNKIYWDTYAEANRIVLKALMENNVHLMAGTDANVPVTVPGFSLHDELKSLNAAGMTPAQVLRSATAAPAEWMGVKSGKVVPGYRADLLLLNKNPLQNIEHTQSIESVILGGRLMDRNQLDQILKAVKDANDESRTEDIVVYQHGSRH